MQTIQIITVVGARPQFVKAAAMSRAIALHNSLGETNVQERIIHTGQHYDDAMSAVFFDQLKIPKPWRNLEVGSGPHGKQTGLMMERLEEVLTDDRPDLLLNYGDTNSTLASALVAAKMHIPVAHVEAGLRSFNRKMPEEINRIMTDHISTWLFCPSIKSQEQLASEGIHNGVHVAGDVMYDALLFNLELAKKQSQILDELSLQPGAYHLATVHRAENTDAADKLSGIFKALGDLGQTVVLPLHPRTENCLTRHKLNVPPNVRTIPPASYLDMLQLISGARIVFTDSGGLQKEAFWLDKPCVTLREETEWTELVDEGWNQLVGSDPDKILAAEANALMTPKDRKEVYGDGTASESICRLLVDSF